MIFKVASKQAQICPEIQKKSHSKQGQGVIQTRISLPSNTTPTNRQDPLLEISQNEICAKFSNEEFGDCRLKISARTTHGANVCQEEEKTTPIAPFLCQRTSSLLPDNWKIHKKRIRYGYSQLFHFRQLISFQTIYALISLQLITKLIVPCNGYSTPFYSQDDTQEILQSSQPQTYYHPYISGGITLDNEIRDSNLEDLEEQQKEDTSSELIGCLFSPDVCTQDEICFDDLILGRCISADWEAVEDEGLHPLSTDDQYLLTAEVERLLEQGFRWDDAYTQCVLQTLINSFRFSRLEYDTTLCKAAFLPEVLVERRVDVPKKFILPNDDIDKNNNNNNQNNNADASFEDNPDDDDDQVQEQTLQTSSRDEKRSTIPRRLMLSEDDNLSYLMPPTALQNSLPEIDKPQFISSYQNTDGEDEDEDVNNDNHDSEPGEIEIGPRSLIQYPPFNFYVRQEEDGGILIEPDQISALNRVNQDQSNNDDDDDQELQYIIPSFAMQPTTQVSTESSIPIQIPFLSPPQQQQQLGDLVWTTNDNQAPYQENDGQLSDLGIIAASEHRQIPLQFHPTIWFDDDEISSPFDTEIDEDGEDPYADMAGIAIDQDPDSININYQMPESPSAETEENSDRGLYIYNNIPNFNSHGIFFGDYLSPLNDNQDEPSVGELEGESSANDEYDRNEENQEEVIDLPEYRLPDGEFLDRHKFSTFSKRSILSSLLNKEPHEEAEEYNESYEYPVIVSMDGKKVPSVHYTRHAAEEPSGLREDIDVYEPTDIDDNEGAALDNTEGEIVYADAPTNTDGDVTFSDEGENEYGNENALSSFTFNRKERLDVKKPGPFSPNSENNFFFKKLIEAQKESKDVKKSDESQTMLGDPFGPRRSNYSADGKGQIEYEMPLQVIRPDPKKRISTTRVGEFVFNDPIQEENKYLHLMMKKRFDTLAQGSDLIHLLADEFGIPRHALGDPSIDDHHVQFRVDPNPQNVDAASMATRLENDIELKKRISSELDVDVGQAAPGSRNDYEVNKFPASASTNLLFIVLVSVSALAVLLLSSAILVLIRHCVRNRRRQSAENKLKNQDILESERGKVQEEYKQLCRDWSKSTNSKTVQPDTTTTSLVSNGNKSQQTTSSTIKKLQGHDSKSDGSGRSSTSSWGEEPTSTNMDISTGHMVLAYMEDHLKNKQRLEQEWVALCGYEAEPCATTIAFKTENKKKNRYPDKLPYDHNRVMLNAVLNGSNSDYINASSVTDHDPRNPSYIVTQGPLAQTVADFWQMIWEQGCVVIVMLSRLQDNGYQLCHRYWPEEGSEQYHIFEVHLVSEHVWCDDYLVRSVYLKNTRTGETRTVTQFHFRSWPAQSVPSSTKALLEFRRKVNKSYRGRSAPICVHCSDGVGRSGTYALIDMVLNRMAKGCKEIDIAATLEHIRDQRSGMVQTRPQFEFCLMAVAEEVHAILKALLP